MIHIETYTPNYDEDIAKIVENFHDESLSQYDSGFDKEAVLRTIRSFDGDQASNAFLLIIDGKCQGLLAGTEISSLVNNKRTFQELIWYVNLPFRRYGVKLLERVQEILKDRGFDTLIMAVMENSKTKKIKNLYKAMGFKLCESHYIRSL